MSKLRELRKRVGITAVELAEKSGVKERTIRSYELGQRDIKKMSLENAIKLAKVLDCKVEELVEQD